MPRIVHVISTPSGIGGAERVLVAIALAKRPGWEQIIVNVSDDNRELTAACAPTTVRTPSGGPRLLGGLRAVASGLEEFHPDLVHAHLPLAMVTVAGLRRRGERVRVATHHHGDHFVYSKRRLAGRLDRTAGTRFDAVIAPSEAVRAFLLSHYHYKASTVRTITNGWSGSLPASSIPRQAPDPTVVSIANFRPEKNHELLLRAFVLVREQIPQARLLLVGGGPREGKIRRLADSLGLRSVVEFTGHVEDVWPHLSRSHLFVLASNYETMGIAVLEAMAAGLPVVATSIGGVPEFVHPGVNGELVEPGDAAGMAAAIVRILSSPPLAQSLGAAGRTTAAENTSERMVNRYFSLYSELLSKSGG